MTLSSSNDAEGETDLVVTYSRHCFLFLEHLPRCQIQSCGGKDKEVNSVPLSNT